MEITLAQAIDIRSAINKQIQSLINERRSVAFVTVPKGETYEITGRKISEIEADLETVRNDYIEIDNLINTNNLVPIIEWDNKLISVYTAIELAKQIQGEAKISEEFGTKKKQEVQNSWQGGSTNITYATYDIESYRQQSIKLSRKARLLSQTIQSTNHKISFAFAGVERYI